MLATRRRDVLVGILGVLVAGCAGRSPTVDEEPAAIAERFDCTDADRPEPDVRRGVEVTVESDGKTRTYETVGSTDYPEPPESQDEAAVDELLQEHEAAFRRNQLVETYEEELVDFSIEFGEVQSIGRRGDVQRFVLSYDEVFETVDAAGHGPIDVAYAIDESGLVRLGHVDAEELEDPNVPAEGQLVVCF